MLYGFYLDEYEIMQGLGEGGVGCILKVRDTDGDEYAMKIIGIDSGTESIDHENEIGRELSTLESISPFNVHVYDLLHITEPLSAHMNNKISIYCKKAHQRWHDNINEFIIILMEPIEGDTLLEYINDENEITNKFVVEFIFGLVHTLLVLHDEIGFAHNDLTPNNIILKDYDNIQGISNISGFRYNAGTTVIPVMIDFDRSTTNELSVDSNIFGSFYILSPEVLFQFMFNGRVPLRDVSNDIWAVAMNTIYMLFPMNMLISSDTNYAPRAEMAFQSEFEMIFESKLANTGYDIFYTEYSVLLLFRALLISESFNGPTDLRKLDYDPLNAPLFDNYKQLMVMYNETKNDHPLLGIKAILSNRLDAETLELLGQMFSLNHRQRIRPSLLEQKAFKTYMNH